MRTRAILEGHADDVSTMAVAPHGNWLATGNSDSSVRIWRTSTAQPSALMRLEGRVDTCSWIGNNGLAVGGSGGLYAFDFLAGPTLPTPQRR